MESVWIFNGEGREIPSAVFSDLRLAEEWIGKHKLSGLLTRYPIDTSVHDWAVANGYFNPKYPSHNTPEWIGGFTSANLEHYHYENGER